MKNTKRVLSRIMALSMVAGLTACDSTGNGDTTNATTTTTTAATVAVNTEALKEEEVAALDDVTSQLGEVELENKTIKWLAHYDKNPTSDGKSKSVPLEMFETKYGGNIQWYPTTWDTRFADLSTYVLGGEGIDFWPGDDTGNYPRGIVTGMFQPVDEYVDLNSDLWKPMAAGMELYNFGGKHYEFVTDITAESLCFYSKKTIEENGFDDPYELWRAGNWNWDTFKSMMFEFCDPDADKWGLDGWWSEKALYLSAGVPIVGTDSSNKLVCNINNATVEKAMNFEYELFTNNCTLPKEQFGWSTQEKFMGEGKELFYMCGAWCTQSDPATWGMGIDPEDLMFVPVPSPAGSDNYQAATVAGYALVKGAANPEGVKLYVECELLANADPATQEIGDRKLKDDCKWSDELISLNKEINDIAKKYPVVDHCNGASADIQSLTTEAGDGNGTRGPLHGKNWATVREEVADTVNLLVEEVADQLNAL